MILEYHVGPDFIDRRAPLRAEHLALAQAAVDRGELRLAGALDPPDRALLVFTDSSVAEAFARNDPYVRGGLVTRWTVRLWNVVIGCDFSPIG